MKIPPTFTVIPCSGKQPLVDWKQFIDRRISEEEQRNIDEKFRNADKGFVCGPISNLFVLDVDGVEGEKSLIGYHIPRTPSVKSPHGTHYYFKWIPELDNKITTGVNILPKVDVRGHGGFIAFYGWKLPPFITPFAAPPQWLIDLLRDKNEAHEISAEFKRLDYAAALKGIQAGVNRHDTFYRLAGGLRARGFEPLEIYEFLAPKAREVGLPDEDLQETCSRVARYPAGQRPPVEELDIDQSFEEYMADSPPVEYLVPGVFAKRSINLITGLSETCKTWCLTDLAIELTRPLNGSWLGLYPVKQAKVLYIDQERDKTENHRRFNSLISAKGLAIKDFSHHLVVKCGTTYRMDLPQSVESLRRVLDRQKPDVVMVDSFKSFQSADTNHNPAMMAVFENIKALKQEFGCAFIFIHHESKAAFERVDVNKKKEAVTFKYVAGAAAIFEVPESILITAKNGEGSSWLHHVKNTLGPKVAPVIVTVEDVVPDHSQIKVIAR